MTRGKRIALELLAPAPLGLLVMFLLYGMKMVPMGDRASLFSPDVLVWIGIDLFYAYLLAGIPSLVFAIILEWIFSRGLDPATWSAAVLSTALGGIAGCAIVMVPGLMEPENFPLGAFLFFAPLGLVVGFTVGFVTMRFSLRREASRPGGGRDLAAAGCLVAPALAWSMTRHEPAWLVMWAIAFAEFFAVKILTLSGLWRAAPAWRVVAYIGLWPGLDAAAFLGARSGLKAEKPRAGEWMFAAAKFAGGFIAMAWAVRHAGTAAPLLVGWVGMIGLIFSLHFGFLHLVSLAWRRAGVAAAPIMRMPLGARSLAEFWGERWNAAFADVARRFVGRPLARRWGGARAGAFVFLVSGAVHESVISLPAGGGWGGPTAYFALQAAGAWGEKTTAGRALGLGRGGRGWTWTILVAALPVPLLFHPAFVTRVMAPFFATLAEFKP